MLIVLTDEYVAAALKIYRVTSKTCSTLRALLQPQKASERSCSLQCDFSLQVIDKIF